MKPIVESKTIWLNAITGISLFFPPVQAWVSTHPVEIVTLLSSANFLLRLVTKQKIVLFNEE